MPLQELRYVPDDLRSWNQYLRSVALELEPFSVGEAELMEEGVTEEKVAPDAISSDKIQDNAVVTSKILDDNVTYAKIQNVSATDKILGRSSSGAGNIEEIPCTAAGRALIDDADATAQRTTLGLGTAATQNTGTSGANVPLLSAANTWTLAQTFSAPPIVPSYTVAGVPSASPAAQIAYISNESGGAVLAFSDGTNWRRVTDRAIIS